MLEALLTRFGVRKIEALGKTFDPTKHEAMFEVEDPTQAPGTIVQWKTATRSTIASYGPPASSSPDDHGTRRLRMFESGHRRRPRYR